MFRKLLRPWVIRRLLSAQLQRGSHRGGTGNVREMPGGPCPAHRADLATLSHGRETSVSLNTWLLFFQLSETTAESHLMEKELDELKSVSRRRK